MRDEAGAGAVLLRLLGAGCLLIVVAVAVARAYVWAHLRFSPSPNGLDDPTVSIWVQRLSLVAALFAFAWAANEAPRARVWRRALVGIAFGAAIYAGTAFEPTIVKPFGHYLYRLGSGD